MADLEESDYLEKSEDNSSSDEEEQHEGPFKQPRKDAVYNTVGLHEKLEEIGWPENVEWIQTLSITIPDAWPIDVDDDLHRETSFYTQALDGARQAYQKFQSLGIPFQRPMDYYAEMVKTDTHMLKVKDKLLNEKSKLEEMDERRKARDAKKFAKEVQAEKLKERSKRKKEDIESVKKWRKVREKSGFTESGEDAPVDLDTGNKKQFGKFNKKHLDRRLPKSRQFRDTKYGNGGRRSDKRNTAESSADESSFRASFKGRGRGGSSRGGGPGGARGGGSFRGRYGSRGRSSNSRGLSRGRGRGRG